MDITELLRDNRDELTGLLDKQAFYVWAQELIDTADPERQLAFIFFDMANFKLFNADYGFEKGDELLIEIGKIIEEIFAGQLVARFSGDHFVVCADTNQIVPSIVEVRQRVKKLQKNINLEIKAGVYVLDGTIKDAVRCSDRARTACASIKRKYDVEYRFYDEELAGRISRKQFIIDNLDEALEKGYVQPFYQPVVRTLTGEVCGWEALVRWIDPNRGMVFPNEFIPVLEEYRLIHVLDSYIMEQVIKSKPTLPVSINLSRLDFEALDVVKLIDVLIKEYDADPAMFHFEITESVFMDNPHFIQSKIDDMRAKGYQVWMDDFGSGYSSLNVLKNFQLDLVKIDMEFLRGFESSDDGKIIIKHVVSLLKNLGFHTLAEGVETQEQYDFLKDLGCEMIQGYLIGRPMPYEESVNAIERSGRGFEDLNNRMLYDKIGQIDILKQNPLETLRTNLVGNALPLAIGIVKDDKWKFAYLNDAYFQEIRGHGTNDVEIVEEMINRHDMSWVQRDLFWELLESTRDTDKVENMEFVENGNVVTIRVRHIDYDLDTNSHIYLISLRTIAMHMNESFEHKMEIVSNYMFSFYECIDLFSLDDEYYENIYLSNSKVHIDYDSKKPTEVIEELAREKIHPEDQPFFLECFNLDNAKTRLSTEKNGIKILLIRIKNFRSIYVWKTVTIRVVKFLDKDVLISCVAEASNEFSKYMDSFVEQDGINYAKAKAYRERYSYESILKMVPAGVFWKDKDRCFVGANQMFLDYYGLESVDDILGKTDEDMGWHIDPEPFKKLEEDVINKGITIKNVRGECIVKGQVRQIVASKQPLINDGEIIGLIGFFNDVTDMMEERDKLEHLSNTDELTQLQNRRAFTTILQKYVSQYYKEHMDFVMLMIDIDKFKQINDMFGHDFGDDVLKVSAEIIRSVTSNNSVAFRLGGDEFTILHQFKEKSEIKSITQELITKFAQIEKIAGLDIKVRVSIGTAIFSESDDILHLTKNADKKMYEDKQSHR